MLGLLGAMMVSGLLSLYLKPRGAPCRCPGAGRGWKAIIPARSWLIRGRCWQRLDGLPENDERVVRCPECGTVVHRARRLRDGHRIRLGNIALGCLILTLGSGTTSWLRGGTWTHTLPTLPLVMIAKAEFITHRSTIRKDLRARTEDGQLSDLAKSMLAERLTKEWRDDDRRWNSIKAREDMGLIGTAGLEAVRWEFLHGDAQSKERCVEFLGWFDDEPSEQLIDVWIEALNVGKFNDDRNNRDRATHFLRKNFIKARPKLLQLLHTGKRLQRFRSAKILARACDPETMEAVVEILISHLEDNELWGDAKSAGDALASLGPRGRPLLEPYMDTLDLQGRWWLGDIDLKVRRHSSEAWEAWYGISEEKRVGLDHEWGPWHFLSEIDDAPQYLLDQVRLETNDASR